MAILKPDKTTTLGGVTVNEYLLTKHNPNHIDIPSVSMEGKIIGVTIHNTSWITTAAGTTPAEQYTRARHGLTLNPRSVLFLLWKTPRKYVKQDIMCLMQTERLFILLRSLLMKLPVRLFRENGTTVLTAKTGSQMPDMTTMPCRNV